MPAKSEKQRRFMALCLNNPKKAKTKCPSKDVASEFVHSESISSKQAIKFLFEAILLEMDPRQPYVPDVRVTTPKTWDQVYKERTKEMEDKKKAEEKAELQKKGKQEHEKPDDQNKHKGFIDNLVNYMKFYFAGIPPKG